MTQKRQRKPLTNPPVPLKLQDSLVDIPDNQDGSTDIIKRNIESVGELLSEELKSRFEDPRKVKKILERMTVAELMDYSLRILNTMKKNQIIVPKGFQVNMQQVNHYANAIANSPVRKKELREQARRQLRRLPT